MVVKHSLSMSAPSLLYIPFSVTVIEFIMPTAYANVVKIDYLICQMSVNIMHCIPHPHIMYVCMYVCTYVCVCTR